MAEAIVNHSLGEKWQAVSAGTHPAGYVHPRALQVLEEIGIEHTGRSKHVNHFQDETFDLVITVCDQASEECPVWLGDGDVLHVGYQDPADATGTTGEILSAFREVRDLIKKEIPRVLKKYQQEHKSKQESEGRDD